MTGQHSPLLPEVAHRSLYEISGCIADINTMLIGRNELRHLSEAEAALNALRAEVAALRVDGERYRWLTQCKRVPWGAFLENAHEVGIDAAIDASREALQPGEGKK